jgi:hypothetical protein
MDCQAGGFNRSIFEAKIKSGHQLIGLLAAVASIFFVKRLMLVKVAKLRLIGAAACWFK